MRVKHVRRRLKAGEPSVGRWLSLPPPEAARYLGQIEFDGMTVDTKHQPIDPHFMLAQACAPLAAIRGAARPPADEIARY
jgi:2-keto-3-deoxy-L-rhamnonate aldolase RhmA